MKKQFLVLIIICSYLLISCIRKHSATSSTIGDKNISDTSNFVVIPLDSVGFRMFDTLYKPTELSLTELETLDSLIKIFAKDNEGSLSTDKVGHSKLDLSKRTYKRQYVPAMAPNGQKKVWVNCLCSNSVEDWRHKVIIVKDGGPCYFNVLINLSDKSYSYFFVNGEG
jgi:hypothetical protein